MGQARDSSTAPPSAGPEGDGVHPRLGTAPPSASMREVLGPKESGQHGTPYGLAKGMDHVPG